MVEVMGCGRSTHMASPSSDNSRRQLNVSRSKNKLLSNNSKGGDGKGNKKQKTESDTGKSDLTTKTTIDTLIESDDKTGAGQENGGVVHPEGSEQNGVKLSFKMAFKDTSSNTTFLAQAKISTSQIDFFKMLDEKIAKGKDYASRSNSVISGSTINEFHHI